MSLIDENHYSVKLYYIKKLKAMRIDIIKYVMIRRLKTKLKNQLYLFNYV